MSNERVDSRSLPPCLPPPATTCHLHWSNYEPHNEDGPHSKKPHSDYEVFHYEVDPHYEAHSGLRPHSYKIVRCEQWCEIRLIVHI